MTASRESHNEPTAPQYLVYPVIWDDVELSVVGANFITDKACVIDFGESFDISDPPSDLGIPQIYCSPEYVLDKNVGISSDIWALGCTLFEIRTGRRLFDMFDDDVDEYLCKLAVILGKFPEPWWSTAWRARKEFFEDNADANGRAVEIRRGAPMDAVAYPAYCEDGTEIFTIQQPEPRSLQEALAPGLFCESRHGPKDVRRDIFREEIDLFSELLRMILKYTPKERLTAKKVLDHAWFKL